MCSLQRCSAALGMKPGYTVPGESCLWCFQKWHSDFPTSAVELWGLTAGRARLAAQQWEGALGGLGLKCSLTSEALRQATY